MTERFRNFLTSVRKGEQRWVYPCAGFTALALLLLTLFYIDAHDLFPEPFWKRNLTIGHVTRAFGTVKHTPSRASDQFEFGWRRLESGRSLLVPLELGDQLQTGEQSATEILFFGGTTLQLEPGSVLRVEDDGKDVAVRLVLGRGYLEFPPQGSGEQSFVFRDSEGKLSPLPDDKRIVMTLNAAESLEDAVEIEVVDTDESPVTASDLELRLMARGPEEQLIVPPLDQDELNPEAAASGRSTRRDLRPPGLEGPSLGPDNEAEVDIEAEEPPMFRWARAEGPEADNVIAYEIVVRPAFGYQTDDRARKNRVMKQRKKLQHKIEKVNGAGVFLWSVRAVTAGGIRGPASTPRWLEIKFPKQLLPPNLLAPKVE